MGSATGKKTNERAVLRLLGFKVCRTALNVFSSDWTMAITLKFDGMPGCFRSRLSARSLEVMSSPFSGMFGVFVSVTPWGWRAFLRISPFRLECVLFIFVDFL